MKVLLKDEVFTYLIDYSKSLSCLGFKEILSETSNQANNAISKIEESEGLTLG